MMVMTTEQDEAPHVPRMRKYPPEVVAHARRNTLAGRPVMPEEIARTIALLVSSGGESGALLAEERRS
jgi:hypothetical protein